MRVVLSQIGKSNHSNTSCLEALPFVELLELTIVPVLRLILLEFVSGAALASDVVLCIYRVLGSGFP